MSSKPIIPESFTFTQKVAVSTMQALASVNSTESAMPDLSSITSEELIELEAYGLAVIVALRSHGIKISYD